MTPARARGGAAASERPAPLARSAGQCLAAGQCPAGGPAADGSGLLAQPEAGEQPEGKKPAAVNAVRRAAWENASSPWRGRLRGRRRAGLSPRRRSAYRVRRRPALPGGGRGDTGQPLGELGAERAEQHRAQDGGTERRANLPARALGSPLAAAGRGTSASATPASWAVA